jgi:hypothetical protein
MALALAPIGPQDAMNWKAVIRTSFVVCLVSVLGVSWAQAERRPEGDRWPRRMARDAQRGSEAPPALDVHARTDAWREEQPAGKRARGAHAGRRERP